MLHVNMSTMTVGSLPRLVTSCRFFLSVPSRCYLASQCCVLASWSFRRLILNFFRTSSTAPITLRTSAFLFFSYAVNSFFTTASRTSRACVRYYCQLGQTKAVLALCLTGEHFESFVFFPLPATDFTSVPQTLLRARAFAFFLSSLTVVFLSLFLTLFFSLWLTLSVSSLFTCHLYFYFLVIEPHHAFRLKFGSVSYISFVFVDCLMILFSFGVSFMCNKARPNKSLMYQFTIIFMVLTVFWWLVCRDHSFLLARSSICWEYLLLVFNYMHRYSNFAVYVLLFKINNIFKDDVGIIPIFFRVS